jgi:hypothetical protein
MTILLASWGMGNTLAVRSDTGEVVRSDGPDVARIIARLSEPARRWLPGEAVVTTDSGDPEHVLSVLLAIPGATVTPDHLD